MLLAIFPLSFISAFTIPEVFAYYSKIEKPKPTKKEIVLYLPYPFGMLFVVSPS